MLAIASTLPKADFSGERDTERERGCPDTQGGGGARIYYTRHQDKLSQVVCMGDTKGNEEIVHNLIQQLGFKVTIINHFLVMFYCVLRVQK